MSCLRIRVSSGTCVRMRTLSFASAVLALLVVHANPPQALAQSGTWSSAGVTSWNNTARWTGGVVAGGTNNTATFTVGGTASLLSNIVLGNLTTGGTRVQIRSGTQTTYSLLTNEQIEFATTTGTAPAIANTGRLDMFAIIAGSQGFTKSGAGALYLNRPNIYTGVTTIAAGDVRLAENDGLGDSSAGNGTVIQSGAMLRLDNASTSSSISGVQTSEPFTIAGDGLTNLGALRSQAGTGNAFNGAITLSASSSIRANGGAQLTLGGSINPNSHGLLLGDAGGFIVSGGFHGTGSINIGSEGPVTLSGSSSFTGITSVGGQTGLVTMTGYMAGPMDFSPVGVRTLVGTGTFAGGLYVGNNATFAPGASAATSDYGTITSSTIALQSGTLRMGVLNAGTFDKLVMTAGSNGLNLGGNARLELDFASLLPNSSSLKLVDFTGLSGNFNTLVSTGSYAGTWANTSGVWKLSVGSGPSAQDLTFNQATGVLAIVPEPSTIAMLGGTIAAASLIRVVRRRRVG